VEVFLCPVLPDIQDSIALCEGSLSSATCPSDRNAIETRIGTPYWQNDTDKKSEELWEKHVPAPFSQPKISHGPV